MHAARDKWFEMKSALDKSDHLAASTITATSQLSIIITKLLLGQVGAIGFTVEHVCAA